MSPLHLPLPLMSVLSGVLETANGLDKIIKINGNRLLNSRSERTQARESDRGDVVVPIREGDDGGLCMSTRVIKCLKLYMTYKLIPSSMSYICSKGSLGSNREFRRQSKTYNKHDASPYRTRGPLNRYGHQYFQGEYHTNKDCSPKTITILRGQVRMVPVSS